MKRRKCLALAFVATQCGAMAHPLVAKQASIDKLIRVVRHRTDITFVGNGSDYSCSEAADFLQGKLKWRLSKVSTVQHFIEQIGARLTTGGEIHQVRVSDGHMLPSAEFSRQGLERIERPR